MAGGSGHRFGERKQFAPLGGRPLVAWSVDAARSVADGVVLVVPADVVPRESDAAGGGPAPEFGADAVVAGGATRSESVRRGLDAVPSSAAVVVVHDAARPLASAELFRAVVAAVRGGAAGAVPGLAVGDTLKRCDGDRVTGTVDRHGLVAVQTPQAFEAVRLRRAHATGGEATDDAGLLEATGELVVAVPGEPTNLKVTLPGDLVVAEALLAGSRT